LEHEPELIRLMPVLDDPAIRDAPDRDPGDADVPAGRTYPEELTRVLAVRGHLPDDAVALGNEILDDVVARRARDERAECLLPPLSRRRDPWEWVVLDEVGR